MRYTLRSVLVTAVTAVAACGSDSTGANPTYESVAGTYSATLAGVSQGRTLNADFNLTIAQSSRSISGSYSLSGTMDDGFMVVPAQGTGAVLGNIATGNNPSVSLVLQASACQGHTARFSGSYDSANHRLTITGPVEFFGGETCMVGYSYTQTIVLDQ
jgi:hypothetical protein